MAEAKTGLDLTIQKNSALYNETNGFRNLPEDYNIEKNPLLIHTRKSVIDKGQELAHTHDPDDIASVENQLQGTDSDLQSDLIRSWATAIAEQRLPDILKVHITAILRHDLLTKEEDRITRALENTRARKEAIKNVAIKVSEAARKLLKTPEEANDRPDITTEDDILDLFKMPGEEELQAILDGPDTDQSEFVNTIVTDAADVDILPELLPKPVPEDVEAARKLGAQWYNEFKTSNLQGLFAEIAEKRKQSPDLVRNALKEYLSIVATYRLPVPDVAFLLKRNIELARNDNPDLYQQLCDLQKELGEVYIPLVEAEQTDIAGNLVQTKHSLRILENVSEKTHPDYRLAA